MTQAVCWKCGEPKHGAFTRCERCQSVPRTDDELALSLAFITDHYYAPADLAEITARLHAGKIPPRLTPALKEYLAPGVAEAKRMLGLDAHALPPRGSLPLRLRTSNAAPLVACTCLQSGSPQSRWRWP